MRRILLTILLLILISCATIPEEYRDPYKNLSQGTVENFKALSETDKDTYNHYWIYMSLKEREQFINDYNLKQKRQLIANLQQKIRDGDFDEITEKINPELVKKAKIIRTKNWSGEINKLILSNQIQIGMTTEQVELSWGKPQRINKSVFSWGVHEQWVYDYKDMYLYFDDNILKSWQETSRP